MKAMLAACLDAIASGVVFSAVTVAVVVILLCCAIVAVVFVLACIPCMVVGMTLVIPFWLAALWLYRRGYT